MLPVSFTWRHAVGVHGVLVEVGRVEVGGNLGRDGDVEVAEAEALPVEAVEPPASEGELSRGQGRPGGKIRTQRKIVRCLVLYVDRVTIQLLVDYILLGGSAGTAVRVYMANSQMSLSENGSRPAE